MKEVAEDETKDLNITRLECKFALEPLLTEVEGLFEYNQIGM